MAERVLVDTSALYALISSTDQFHHQAWLWYRALVSRREELYITSYALVETIALVHRRLGFTQLRTFMESIQNVIRTYWVTPSVHAEAWDMLVARNSNQLSLVECSVIVVARRLNAQVFAFDNDYRTEGLQVIPR